MQTIGLLGGMSWESTTEYYRLLNRGVQERLGADRSADILLYSLDFGPVAEAQHAGAWDRLADILLQGARRLQRGGADFALLCTNTMHRLLPELKARVELPFLHIADVTAEAVLQAGLRRVGLLGTRFTMEQGFYRERLAAHGIETLIPGERDRALVHRVIYDELCRGRICDPSRHAYREVIGRLEVEGAEGVILGCTEIPLLVRPEDSPLPLFDTTRLHAEAAVRRALAAPPA